MVSLPEIDGRDHDQAKPERVSSRMLKQLSKGIKLILLGDFGERESGIYPDAAAGSLTACALTATSNDVGFVLFDIPVVTR